MNGADFLDTNVVVYAYDDKNPDKQRVARQLLQSGIAGKTVISNQVLAEFAATMLHKAAPPATAHAVMKAIDALCATRVILTDADMVRRAIEARLSYGLHFYDGLIVAAAERAGCLRIWSEDFNVGQKYFGVTVSNHFE
jgi:predicted nucleic acid-binding protein